MNRTNLLILFCISILCIVGLCEGVSAVDCNTTGNIINSTSISNGCVLNYSGTFYFLQLSNLLVVYDNGTKIPIYGINQDYNLTLNPSQSVTVETNHTYEDLYNLFHNNKLYIPDNNVITYFHFDNLSSEGETDNILKDFSNNGNNGTVINVTTSIFNSSCGINNGGCAKFIGLTTWINTSKSVFSDFSNGNYTFSIWVNHPLLTSNVASDQNTFFNTGSGGGNNLTWLTLRNSQYIFRLLTSVQDASRTSTQLPNVWTHISGYYKGSTMKMFVNGVLVSTTNSITYPKAVLQPLNTILTLGKQTGAANLNASIDEFILWNVSKTDSQLNALYNLYTLNHSCITPYYHFFVSENQNACLGKFNVNSSSSEYAITFENNTIFDCNGSSIYGNTTTNSRGIYINAAKNVTIQNCIIYNYAQGIRTDLSSDINIINVTIFNSTYGAIVLHSTSNVLIINSNISSLNGSTGIVYSDISSDNITIQNNIFSISDISENANVGNGIRFNSNINLLIVNNTFYNLANAIYLEFNNTNVLITNNTCFKYDCDKLVLSQASPSGYLNINNITIISNNVNFLNQGLVNFRNISNVFIGYNIINNSILDATFLNIENMSIVHNNITNGFILSNTSTSITFSSGTYMRNINVSGNIIINSGRNAILISQNNYTNLIIEKNYIFNSTQTPNSASPLIYFTGLSIGDGIVDNNILNLSADILLINQFNKMSLNITNNIFEDSSGNGDSYGGAIHINNGNNTIVNIFNNTFNKMSCYGILTQKAQNINIKNNTFNFDFQNNINKRSNCAYEAITAINLASVWKTWTSDSTELSTQNVTYLLTYSATNVNINGNTFSGFPVLLQASSPINLTHDLTNYWFRSFSTPDYLIPRQDYYISNNFENVSTTFNETNNNPVSIRDVLGYRYPGYSTSIPFIEFKLHKTYLYFQNMNYTVGYNGTYNPYNSTWATDLFNQSSTLITFSNSTVIYPVTGEINITLQPSEWVYVYDNYTLINLTEGSPQEASPLWIESKTVSSSVTYSSITTYILNSNLTTPINNIVFYPLGQVCPNKVTYLSSLGDTGVTFVCNDKQLYSVTLNEYDSSNTLTLYIYTYKTNTCNNNAQGLVAFAQSFQFIGLLAAVAIIIMMLNDFTKNELTGEELKRKMIWLISVGVIIGVASIVASLLASVC